MGLHGMLQGQLYFICTFTVLWDVMSCSSVEVNHFEVMYRLRAVYNGEHWGGYPGGLQKTEV
jgi:hypothetical protein